MLIELSINGDLSEHTWSVSTLHRRYVIRTQIKQVKLFSINMLIENRKKLFFVNWKKFSQL